uniref:1-Jun n=1 Tax=Schmidtea mediterranea TaxID=79327 RepID=I1ZIG5_SCHMD|nr:1-Jun [Schmidtea mediterranea]
MLSSKHKPNSLNFKDYNNTTGQFTPSTPTVISLLQDMTPTNCGYNFDISDKDEVVKQFSMHYKSIEDSHRQNELQFNYAINNNHNFTMDLLSNDDFQIDVNVNNYSTDYENVNRPLPSESAYSSDVQSCSSNNDSNSSNQPQLVGHVQSAKKRERNRLAAEKCRLKKQGKITELENEKKRRIQENNALLEKVKKRTETLKKLKIFYKKLQMGEFQSQQFY